VLRTVLSPASPLFREARYLLADEPDLRDGGLYHSVLAAIANGNTHRGGIASYIGRKTSDLAHPLNVLQDCGLITREPDLFKDNRTNYRIAEPMLTFYHSVMRPIWSELEDMADGSQTMHELDVVAFGLDDDNRTPLLAIGECKWGDVMGMGHLDRLTRIRALLVAQAKMGAESAKLTCFSAAGFTDELRERAANSSDVVLVAAGDLYR
jgi:hypothetical protein